MNIVMCEPHSWGFEHSTFNAAIVRAVRLAYPEARILFLAEKSHIEHVRHVLTSRAGEHDVTWKPLVIPQRSLSNWQRFPNEFHWGSTFLRITEQFGTDFAMVLAVNNTSLIALKLLMHYHRFNTPTLAIPHALNVLFDRKPLRPWHRAICLHNALSIPWPPSLRLLALGGSIYAGLMKLRCDLKDHIRYFEDPYLWPSVPESYSGEPTGDKVRFGYLGTVIDGFELFSRLADELAPKYPHAEFHLVGFIPWRISNRPYSPHIRGLTTEPLSIEEFHRRSSALTYSIGTRSPEYYRLISSVTFVDSMAVIKPCIYLRNDFVQYYFDRMGDVGYLCDSYAQLRDQVAGILEDFPRERYRRQIVNILNSRAIFTPENASVRLRDIVSEIETDARK